MRARLQRFLSEGLRAQASSKLWVMSTSFCTSRWQFCLSVLQAVTFPKNDNKSNIKKKPIFFRQ
ncbi:hypothetical protein LEP1GSC058_2737 [Leptospira fainei serovar Hurstbridge str. BUT 6]|uniref:Uncharacterized protein n=1 Tax=Leptospira fainei serovar Hurstbridge str. BUT 6 TaxID=1193011 RepID=S3V9J6_9LEPT|nr:hypothetical protein LEP1GSC058_2737 [Leptospira fainei serovar Hurstbridge str. BUT 6]